MAARVKSRVAASSQNSRSQPRSRRLQRALAIAVAAAAIPAYERMMTACAEAANATLTINDTGSNSSFSGGPTFNWSTGNATPTTANTYEVTTGNATGVGSLLRLNTGSATFGGLSLKLDSGGIFLVKTNGTATVGNLILNGGALEINGGTEAGNITLVLGTTSIIEAQANSTVSSVITGGGNLTIDGISPNNANDGQGGAGNFSVNLTGNNSYTGNTGFNQGTLILGNANAIQDSILTINGNGSIAVGNGVLTFGSAAGTAFNAGGISGNGPINLVNSAAAAVTFSIGNGNQTGMNYSGALSGAGGIVKVGNGTQTFSGTDSYTGTTVISGGTLLLTGSLTASSAVTVQGGTLGGNGTISAPVTITSTGILGPHVTSGGFSTLTIGNSLTLNAGATLNYNLGGVGTNSDLTNLIGTGSLSLDPGTDTLNISTLAGFGAGNYTLISVTGSGTLSDSATFTVIGGSLADTYQVAAIGQNLVLVSTAKPSIFWTGAAASVTNGSWDTAGTQNWTSGGSPTSYTEFTPVTFDDGNLSVSPAGATSVTVQSQGVNPATITFNNSANNYSFGSGNITTESIVLNGSGNVTFNDIVSVTSGTSVNAGNLTSNASFTTQTLVASGSGNVTFNGLASATTSTSVSAGNLFANGSFTTPTLSTSGTGTLNVGASGSLNTNIALTLNGGASVFSNASQTVASLTGNAPLTLGNTALTVGTGSNYSGAIGGGGSFLTSASSTVVLSANNTYSGGTSIGAGSTLTVGAGSTSGAIGTGNVTVGAGGSLAFNRSDTINLAYGISGNGSVAQSGGPNSVVTLSGANSYSGNTTVNNGELILTGTNANAPSGTLQVFNTSATGVASVLSIRNSGALGSGTANTSLAPIRMNALLLPQSSSGLLTTAILEIGTTIGTDPGGNNGDFSYQVVGENATPVLGQISLGSVSNNGVGVGFAAYNASSTTTPRIVALYTPSANSTTLATLQLKTQFGSGNGDHLTLGSATSNNTLILLNPIDVNSGPSRRFASIRGVGIAPEGEYTGAIINTGQGSNELLDFSGNGGLIFDSNATSVLATNTPLSAIPGYPGTGGNPTQVGSLQIDGGAVFVAAADPATNAGITYGNATTFNIPSSAKGALGAGNATLQLGTSSSVNPSVTNPGGSAAFNTIFTAPTANIAFMLYGDGATGSNGSQSSLNQGVGTNSTIFTNRNVVVGGTGVTYGSATLGIATDDYGAMNGSISLNQPTANGTTTFTARNGGRVDFGGVISGVGSVLVGNSTVEGDGTFAGIAMNNNGTIVFQGTNTYQGNTTITAGKLYVDGSTVAASQFAVGSGTTLGGNGTIGGNATVAAGAIIEAGHTGNGNLTIGGGLTLSGNSTLNLGALHNPIGGIGALNVLGGITFNGSTITVALTGSASVGNFSIITAPGVGATLTNTPTDFALAQLPNRAVGGLFASNTGEVDLDITSINSIIWTGIGSSHWDGNSTSNQNWSELGNATAYIDSPGDSVIFDDTASTGNVSITQQDVHPTSVTFNNSALTYTITGNHAIAGGTGLTVGNGTSTGTVILQNVNTFTGATVISSGTLQLGNGTAGNDGSISGTSSITDNGTLVYDLFSSQTYAGVIGGSGSVSLTGPGTVILRSANSYSGGTTITSGTLQLGTGFLGQDGSVSGNITDNSALVFNYKSAVTYAGIISGTGTVAATGTGTIVLAGTSSYSGGTTINSGVLASSTALTSSGTNSSIGTGNLTINGGTFRAASGGSTDRTIAIGSSGGSLDTNATTTYAGSLTGSGNVTFLDSSHTSQPWIITGNSASFSGTFSVGDGANANSGFVEYNSNNIDPFGTGTVQVNTGGIVTADNGATNPSTLANNIVLNGGALGTQTPAMTYTGTVSVAGNSKIGNPVASFAGNVTFTNTIGSPGAATLTVASGSPTTVVLFTGNNTYAGSTSVTGGILQIGNGTAGINNGTSGYTVAAASTLVFDQPNGTTGNRAIASSGTVIGLEPNGNTNTLSGSISGTGGFIQNGNGTTKLTSAGSSFTGNVTINAGTLTASSNGTGGGNTTLGSDAAAGRTITVNSGGTLSFAINDVFGGTGSANIPAILVNGGTVSSTRYNQLGNITLSGGTLVSNSIDTGVFQGYGLGSTVTVIGNAASTISSSNAVAGNATIGGEHLAAVTTFNVASTGVAPTPDLTVSAPLRNVGASAAAASLIKSGNGTMLLSGDNTFTGGATINGGILQINTASSLGAATGNVTINAGGTLEAIASITAPATRNFFVGTGSGGAIQVDGNGTYAVTGNVSDATSAGSLIKTGAGELDLNGTNSYTGNTSVTAGVLRTTNLSGALTVGTGSANSGTIAVGPNATVAGTLALSSASATHTLNGNGTYQWKITGVGTGGVAPATGNSGSLGLTPGNGTEGTDWDLVNISGALNLSTLTSASPFHIAPTGNITSNSTSYSWIIAQAPLGNITLPTGYTPPVGQGTSSEDMTNGGSNGAFVLDTSGLIDNSLSGSPSASQFSLEAVNIGSHEDLVLDYTFAATPEPGTMILVLTGAMPMLTARRRRRRQISNTWNERHTHVG